MLVSKSGAAEVVPETSNFPFGPVVPMPTLPPAITFKPAVPPTLRREEKRLVEEAVVEKKFVVVALVPVALTKIRSVRLRVEEMISVNVPVVEKKLVVVAEVPVALMKVKFWRVVEPVRSRFGKVARPLVVRDDAIVIEPVKLAAEEIVWPLMRPEVMGPAVSVPMFPKVEKRFVEEAVVEKKLVVVAEVPVALANSTVSNTECLTTVRSPVMLAEPAVRVPMFPKVEKRFVEEAVVEKKLVEVALVVVE